MPRNSGRSRCQHAGCGKLTGGAEYCKNHFRKCAAVGCPARIRETSIVCVNHADLGRKRCQSRNCSCLARAGDEYCGNHKFPCRKDGCPNRTRDGGICSRCLSRTPLDTRTETRRRFPGSGQLGELTAMIRSYEIVQGESGELGQIARARLPVLRQEFELLKRVKHGSIKL